MPLHRTGQILRLAVVALAVALSPRPAVGQLPNPRLTGLVPSGGRSGGTVEVVVRGDDLDEPTSILFSHPGISGTLQANAAPAWQRTRETPFVVTIARDVPPGLYEARVAGRFGLSTSWPFCVDDIPVVQEAAGNDSPDKAMAIEPDTVIEGELLGTRVDYFRFRGMPGQRFVLVCESRSLHGRFDLMVEVSGPERQLLGSAIATKIRDPRLPIAVRDAGDHMIRVSDAVFRAGDPKDGPADRYRIALSSRPYVSAVWPPVAVAGSSGTHRLLGFLLPEGRPVGSRGLEEIEVALPALRATSRRSGDAHPLNGLAMLGIDVGTHRLTTSAGLSNPVPVVVAAAPPVLEVEPNDRSLPQPLRLPGDVVGRFDRPGDTDWYAFDAAKGDRLAVEVTSERLGAVADVAVVVEQASRDAQGREQVKVVAEQDDPPRRFTHPPCDFESSDPRLVFTADRDGTYRIGVRNLAGGSYSDTGVAYRLTVRPAVGDFRLLAVAGDPGSTPGDASDVTLAVPTVPRLRGGGRCPIVVQVHRVDGFDGPVTLAVDGLPPGVSCQPIPVAAEVHEASVVIEAAADVAAWRGPISVVGTARVGEEERRHDATWAAVTWTKKGNNQTSARLVDEMPLEVMGEPAPLRISATQAAFGPVVRGGKLTIPFAVESAAELKGPVRVEVRELPAAKPGPPPTKSLEAGQTAGAIEVTIPADTPPGERVIHLVAQAPLLVSRNPEALAAATAALAEFEARKGALQEAADAANQKAAAARAAVKAADAGDKTALSAAEAAQSDAEKALAAARVEVEAHLKGEKPLGQLVAGVKKVNEPKPTVVFAVSGPIRLTVTKP